MCRDSWLCSTEQPHEGYSGPDAPSGGAEGTALFQHCLDGACGNHISTSGCTVWAHRRSHLQDHTQTSVRANYTVPYRLGSLRLLQVLKPQKCVQSPAGGRRKQKPWPSHTQFPPTRRSLEENTQTTLGLTASTMNLFFPYTSLDLQDPGWSQTSSSCHHYPKVLSPASNSQLDLNLCLNSWEKLLLQV